QDAAGIITCENAKVFLRKSNGLVKDVFHARHMLRLKGNMGIGHVRYPTAGCSSSAESQPFYVNSPYGIALAHNGNLTNAEKIKRDLYMEDLRHLNTDSDSEILLNVFAHELQHLGKLRLEVDDIFSAVSGVHQRCRGGYTAAALITGYGVVAFRDPFGIRPLCMGEREDETGKKEYMVASESVAVDTLGYRLIRELDPGEAVYISADGVLHTRQCAQNPQLSPCIFEHVYFARPDTILDNVHVHKARLRMGEKLAFKILREWPDHDIDVVIPIPDTSRTAASQLAYTLDVVFREGFIKNRYIGRTFIMPGQKLRKKSVRQKLNPLQLEFKGKNVLLVDDSIVRGTTSAQIIEMARSAGARKVYFASAAPPVRYPNVYGIDMPVASELIAHGRNEREVAEWIGADHLIFQDLQDLIDSVQEGNPQIKQFDTSVFDANYVTGGIDDAYLERLEASRCDAEKGQRDESDDEVLGVYNAN
ncbi:MAG: amidophosphoribosyltransferase, partial [Gammaproteobacteria bacterium]|nr:amidophosphoribosyltransferase [Gammaproteobacteria bacterium]